MDARTGRRQKRLSKQQEQRTATAVGGRTQANSGATRLGGGGDVRGGTYRVECKFTEKDEYVLRYPELDKIRKHAIQTLEEPVLQFAFRSRTGKFDQYAAVKWSGSVTQETITWEAKGKTFSVTQDDIKGPLLNGRRLRIQFLIDMVQHSFEVLRWDDFLTRREAA